MTGARGAFMEEQIGVLEPFGVVAFGLVSAAGSQVVEVHRSEDGASFDVIAGGTPELTAEVLERLAKLGLDGGTLRRTTVTSAGEAATLAQRVLDEGFAAAPESALDVQHASRRQAVMVERKLVGLRERIGKVLSGLLPSEAFTLDGDGDYTFPFDTTRVFVGPRAMPDGTAVVLVFAATNIGIEASPELGLFLSEANFGVAFGRFALDVANGVVWFGQNLYGESFTDEELTFLVRMVAMTSDAFDERIAAQFGGQPFNPPGAAAPSAEPTPTKPTYAGYL
ncbi:MAG TPA: YbjN domain-containing protein [Acidimicrobiales bacterium]